jgi:hypothetical protein
MTRNDLKDLIKQVIVESRVRSSPVGYNAAIRAAAEKLKQKQSDDAVKAAADSEKADQVGKLPDDPIDRHMAMADKYQSRLTNITHRVGQLSTRIQDLESQIVKRSDENEIEYVERVLGIVKEKTQLEIDRLEYMMSLEQMKNDMQKLLKK